MHTIRPLVLSTGGGVGVHAITVAPFEDSLFAFVARLVFFWIFSLAAAFVFVFPVFALVKKLRSPSLPIAAAWGAMIAVGASILLLGWHSYVLDWGTAVMWVAPGAASGLAYALLVRRSRVNGENLGSQ
jgi:hypothetical protein